ncbi:ABC transporter ATP-binding protein [Algihabitans albus]|uniref:ABC transporter ATP-binding protein n=1 Tax=Algihabitans albus TaxID=2164067 RepID=UPI0035D130DA
MSILETIELQKNFGGVQVARDLSFEMERGEVHCLIGPNGAGKSTFFRLVLGEHQPTAGRIFFDGEDITELASFARIRKGISVKFQVPGIFKDLSVWQNLEIALQHHLEGQGLTAEIARVLEFVDLNAAAGELAGNLSHGQQQWLEIGMAVSVKPRLLLLDEPTAGMSPDETRKTGEMVKTLNTEGVSVLAVEHDMEFVRQIADRVTVLHMGQLFAQGSIAEIEADERVAEIYLGKPDDA